VYLKFYGLAEKPFDPTPDPRFHHLTPAHREALAQLEDGVRERRGFLMLTGEVGTGKTTLIRTLLERLDLKTDAAVVTNSMMPFDDILAYAMEDFGIPVGTTRAQRLSALNGFLIERVRRGLNTVLVIDEAQNLDESALEQVRLLSNFETTTEKLLQILLAGQPELRTKLDQPELRQLKQRIGLRCKIRPLTTEETRRYIGHRLTVARGASSPAAPEIFTQGAIAAICEYSTGIPRVVNIVCDHCLLIGYAEQKTMIDENIAQEAIGYLEGDVEPARRPRGSSLWSRASSLRSRKAGFRLRTSAFRLPQAMPASVAPPSRAPAIRQRFKGPRSRASELGSPAARVPSTGSSIVRNHVGSTGWWVSGIAVAVVALWRVGISGDDPARWADGLAASLERLADLLSRLVS